MTAYEPVEPADEHVVTLGEVGAALLGAASLLGAAVAWGVRWYRR